MDTYTRISFDTLLATLGGFAEEAAPAQRSDRFLSDRQLEVLFDRRLSDRQIEERLGIHNARAYRYYWSPARRRNRA